MDDEQLRSGAWRGMVAFQELIGRHAPGPAPLEREEFVASAVPEIPSSLINAACPRDGALLAPHLDEIARFYSQVPKWGAWTDPDQTQDAEALQGLGLVLDSRPVLMAATAAASTSPPSSLPTPSTRRGNATKRPPPSRPPSSARASTRASATARSARSTATRSGRREPQPSA